MTYLEIAKAHDAEMEKSVATIDEWNKQTAIITRQATDIMALPIVTEGYQKSGKPAALAYQHLCLMALSRLKKHYPFFDAKDPLMARLLAEAKFEVAKCMLLKYECRARRQAYDHLRDCDVQVNKVIRDHYDKYHSKLKELGYAGNQ